MFSLSHISLTCLCVISESNVFSHLKAFNFVTSVASDFTDTLSMRQSFSTSLPYPRWSDVISLSINNLTCSVLMEHPVIFTFLRSFMISSWNILFSFDKLLLVIPNTKFFQRLLSVAASRNRLDTRRQLFKSLNERKWSTWTRISLGKESITITHLSQCNKLYQE